MKETPRYSLEYLSRLVSEHKREKMEAVLKNRTNHITVVLEGVGQPHNASAVLRSCDIFGIQSIHVVEGARRFVAHNEVAKGAAKWLTFFHYPTIQSCITRLKQKGYTIVATTPHAKEYSLSQVQVENKLALLFGAELQGLSPEALALADMQVRIPMFGFTESFNISVSASLCLYELVTKLHASQVTWRVTPDQKRALKRVWCERVLGMADGREQSKRYGCNTYE